LERETHQVALVDTDILIDASRGLAQAGSFLDDSMRGPGVTISVVSAMELIGGCRDSAQLAEVKRLLDALRVLPLTEAISNTARSLMESFALSHGLLLPDALIAATALDADIPLCTRNVRHFRVIPDLKVVSPY
jgi:predicted nucleic acid-binding protein